MQVLPAKKQDRSSTRMYSKRVRSQSEKHLAIPCESKQHLNTGHIPLYLIP